MFRVLGIIVTVFIATVPCRAESSDSDRQADVPVRKVVLFSSGVGYFEHSGTVTGDATTELRFKTEQINDILKSLVLQDLDGGHVESVVYPSQDPIAKTLRSFQVDISGNPSLGELLNQVRGAEVSITAQGEQFGGTILGLEQVTKYHGDNTTTAVWVMNILSGGAIRAVELPEARRIELVDSQLQEELSKALATLADARDQDKKPVSLTFKGSGERRVRLGYVVEAPIWKTTYRLVLSDDHPDSAALQGWAIIENQTESDWRNVDLSLVSGRPISFIQNLYQPLYVPRPTVQPELYASLMPALYDDGMDMDDEMWSLGHGKRRVAELREETDKAPPSPTRALKSAQADYARGRRANAGGVSGQIDAVASVASLATAGEIGELFQYVVSGVSLPRQRSAMIPIVTDDINVEKISIYSSSVMANHPLNGAIITNTSGKHLLQGPITVFDGQGYAGDARVDDLPPDQHRMISYAVDLNVLVNSTNVRETNTLRTGKLVKGILHVTRKSVFHQEYAVENKSDSKKTILIEHPFRHGWKLADGLKPIETTDRVYRFKEDVVAGGKREVAVDEERVTSETISLLAADIGQIDYYTRTGEIPQSVRNVLAKAIQLKSALVDTQRKIQEHEKLIRSITDEQQRIRSNMNTVDRRSEYYTRLLSKLDGQETEIEKTQGEIETLQKVLETRRRELETYLLAATVE